MKKSFWFMPLVAALVAVLLAACGGADPGPLPQLPEHVSRNAIAQKFRLLPDSLQLLAVSRSGPGIGDGRMPAG